MRALILSSLFAIGLGLAAAPAGATPISAINGAVAGQSMVDQAQYYYRPRYRARCRTVRVCRWTPYGRRCHLERVCRRGW